MYSSYVWFSWNSLNVEPFQCNIPPAKSTEGEATYTTGLQRGPCRTDVLDRSTILQKDSFLVLNQGQK